MLLTPLVGNLAEVQEEKTQFDTKYGDESNKDRSTKRCSSSLCILEELQRDSAECRALGMAHKTRGADRCFQILCSRRTGPR
jgi:hypothetical protein